MHLAAIGIKKKEGPYSSEASQIYLKTFKEESIMPVVLGKGLY